MKVLINGIIILPDEILYEHALIIEGNRIKDITKKKHLSMGMDVIDCKEQFILPGLIDIHCDCLETHIAPRKGIKFDVSQALFYFDKELLSQGITTMYHSISIANSTIVNKKRTLSVMEQLDIGKTIKKLNINLICNHKFHARLELNTYEVFNDILEMIDKGFIDEVSFMDHSPGQGQYRDLAIYKKEIHKQYGVANKIFEQDIIDICKNKIKATPKQILQVINKCNEKRIPLSYHDVDNNKLVSWMKKNNFTICEFPIYETVATFAKKLELFCLVGAPNILNGKSHNGNLSALELLKTKKANIICSDYYYLSMLSSIFKLNNYGISLNEAVNFGTYYPALAMKIDDRGSLLPNKVADIILVNVKDYVPLVNNVFIGGKLRYSLS